MGNATLAVRDNEVSGETEDIAKPVDSGESVSVVHCRDDVRFQVSLTHCVLLIAENDVVCVMPLHYAVVMRSLEFLQGLP